MVEYLPTKPKGEAMAVSLLIEFPREVWGHDSAIEHLPSMPNASDTILSTSKWAQIEPKALCMLGKLLNP